MVNSKFSQLRSYNCWMMVMMIQAIVVLCLLAGSQATDYCDPELCDAGEEHIGCDNDGDWGDDCPADAELIELDRDAQIVLRDAHNDVRQEWASGNGLLPVKACRMATMRWIPELAEVAEFNVRQCILKHDECRNTEEFKNSGQNLYMSGYSGMDPPDLHDVLREVVQEWANEGQYVTEEQLAEYPENYDGPVIGHFTAVVQERSIGLGCAMSSFEQDDFHMYIVACNYATTNFYGRPVYTACEEAAEECKRGQNVDHPALCTAFEDVDYNYEHS
ncbi:antigen 5 like allergen Cul n 1 [Drosophila grimshawi]|uniref:GH24697 n=1 Tax=Drosophila grimshawi TaxID=7222 RepID=B4JMV0_DROGR|nr:antigen 5 like allergen Cul n 1 [Drosophila grimshawi]EDV92043.1 GH24697 [Drosophila grimshawi]